MIYFIMMFWTDGLENSTRERNIRFTWPYLKRMTSYLQNNGISCECRLYDFSPTKLVEDAIHIPYPLGTYNRAEKLKNIIDSLPDDSYICSMDADVFVYKTDWDSLADILNNLQPNVGEFFSWKGMELPGVEKLNFETLEIDTQCPFGYHFTQGHSGTFGAFYIASVTSIKDVGNYNPKYRVWGGEDDELLSRYMKKYTARRGRLIDFFPIHLHHIMDRDNPQYYNGDDYMKNITGTHDE